MSLSPARKAAFDILLRVERDAAYSDELLHRLELSPRDHRLATELVLGVLRWQRDLDVNLEKPLKRKPSALDREVRVALRLGAYQIRFLERIPARAAVSESVELVKRGPRRGAAGLVNAVLRRTPDASPSLGLSHPSWMIDRWRERLGEQATEALLEQLQQPPPSYLRLSTRFPTEETVRLLEDEGVASEPTSLPYARRLVSGRPQGTPAWDEGRVRIQDLSSQMIPPLLEAGPGNRCLDLCSAPGGKTLQLLDLRGVERLFAGDLHAHRLRRARSLGVEAPTIVLDASTQLPFHVKFDRILVDAPCSGTGSIARNPEIKWRLSVSQIKRLTELQASILDNALSVLSPGGKLVYSTCSIEKEENQEVVDNVLSERPGFAVEDQLERLPGRDPGDGFFGVRIRRT